MFFFFVIKTFLNWTHVTHQISKSLAEGHNKGIHFTQSEIKKKSLTFSHKSCSTSLKIVLLSQDMSQDKTL